MAELEAMTLPECWKHLRLLQPRYSSGSRRQRSGLLDEAEQVTGRHRKSLIRLLRGRLTHKPRTRQRGRSYGPQVEYAVRRIARSLDFPCAERLQPALVPWPTAYSSAFTTCSPTASTIKTSDLPTSTNASAFR